ncbi:hypothetical protein Asppvi_006993 [Aspergillus pseudoviridinutans]|uniref:Uncharacterized protein n=1 Tax=Aspergillus pseudoviridinutans TaxID=1517512 RepID=A0A9P3BB96_9EURO|nr:uncharacterized protein Asppvi_006993 [Aspergillus pseudoviridinutans]GIJ88077.1 hypothetical protein Asppvi_006993 [Aspergillus pseudoviridinutans]
MRHFMNQLGRYFQNWDGYQNLVSQGLRPNAASARTSFIPVYPRPPYSGRQHGAHGMAQHAMQWRRGFDRGEAIHPDSESASLEYTRDVLALLLQDLEGMVRDMGSMTGQGNWILRSMLVQLQIKQNRSLPKERRRLGGR